MFQKKFPHSVLERSLVVALTIAGLYYRDEAIAFLKNVTKADSSLEAVAKMVIDKVNLEYELFNR